MEINVAVINLLGIVLMMLGVYVYERDWLGYRTFCAINAIILLVAAVLVSSFNPGMSWFGKLLADMPLSALALYVVFVILPARQ